MACLKALKQNTLNSHGALSGDMSIMRGGDGRGPRLALRLHGAQGENRAAALTLLVTSV